MDPVKLQEFAQALIDLFGDKRSEVEEAVHTFYNLVVEPMDLPGPDDVVDPIFRAGLSKFSGIGYDSLMNKLNEMAGIVGDEAARNDTDRNATD